MISTFLCEDIIWFKQHMLKDNIVTYLKTIHGILEVYLFGSFFMHIICSSICLKYRCISYFSTFTDFYLIFSFFLTSFFLCMICNEENLVRRMIVKRRTNFEEQTMVYMY